MDESARLTVSGQDNRKSSVELRWEERLARMNDAVEKPPDAAHGATTRPAAAARKASVSRSGRNTAQSSRRSSAVDPRRRSTAGAATSGHGSHGSRRSSHAHHAHFEDHGDDGDDLDADLRKKGRAVYEIDSVGTGTFQVRSLHHVPPHAHTCSLYPPTPLR